MHRCLTIVEVQRTIFHELHKGQRGKATLGSLARTCRTFSNAALDILWENLASILYLIRCLPEDIWDVPAINDCPKTMTFQRPMSRRDWEILSSYSSRIRCLTVPMRHEDDCFLADDVSFALSRPPGPLYPNLRTLCWIDGEERHIPLLQSLLTHSLTNLRLPGSFVLSSGVSMHLISSCVSLRTLRIRGYLDISDVEGWKTLSERLPQLRSLQSFECYAPNEVPIISLSSLPSLTNLSVVLGDNLRLQHPRSSLTPFTFASLETLSLGIADNELSTLTSMLGLLRFRLRTVSFLMKRSPTPDMFRLFFVALVNACDSQRLTRILLAVHPDDWLSSINRHQISLSTLEPLLAFPNVDFFSLDAMCNISLDDDAVDALTEHWPKLTGFYLNESFGWGIRSRVTYRGLIMLFSRCSQLVSFALAVDFTEVDRPHSMVPLSRLGDTVTTRCFQADFVTSMINFPATIAAFLSDICPRLASVGSCPADHYVPLVDDFRRASERWEEVNALLPVFLAVRRQHLGWSEGH